MGPLHLAASEGHVSVVAWLLDQCTTTTERRKIGCVVDRWQQTPMLDALSAGHSDVCMILEQHGCGLDTMSRELLTEKLCCAAFAADTLPILTRLLHAGASPNLSDYDKHTPLHIAASEGNADAVQLLLAKGASPDLRDRWGRTPTDEAANTPELLQLFSEATLPVNQKETVRGKGATSYGTFSHIDSGSRDSSTRLKKTNSNGRGVRKSIQTAANGFIRPRNDVLRTPLLGQAVSNSNRQRQQPLGSTSSKSEGNFADTTIRLSVADSTSRTHTVVSAATAELCAAAAASDLTELQRLLRKKADPRKADYDGRTPLHLAASSGSVAAMELLLAACPTLDINAIDRCRRTPLSDALAHGNHDAASWLQTRGGATWNRPNAARLCWAAFRGDAAELESLVRAGANVNAADYDGRSALMLAACEGHETAVRSLLSMGADPHLKDRHGCSALDEKEMAGMITRVASDAQAQSTTCSKSS